MCTLPRAEQDAAMDDTGACLDEQADAFMQAHPHNQDNVTQLRQLHELHEHFEPESLGHITWREFVWCVILPFGALAVALLGAWWQM